MNQLALSLSSGMFSHGIEREVLPTPPVNGDATFNEDAALLQKFVDGDDTAFAELFDRHHRRLYLYCLKLVGSAEQAEDLMQELWERVIKFRSSPKRIQNPGGFFATITRNLCLNHLKMQRRRSLLNTFIRQPDRTEPVESASDLEELVQRLMMKLPLEHREVLVLNIYCDYEYGEIAEMLGRNVTAIRMRASRARAQLRALIESTLENSNNAAMRELLEHYIARENTP